MLIFVFALLEKTFDHADEGENGGFGVVVGADAGFGFEAVVGVFVVGHGVVVD